MGRNGFAARGPFLAQKGSEPPMKEVRPPQKSLLYYFGIVLLVMMLLNAFVFPRLFTARVEEVQYGEFLKMVDEGRVSQVEVDENEIVFADNATPPGYYKTGRMEDPELARHLYEIGRAHV